MYGSSPSRFGPLLAILGVGMVAVGLLTLMSWVFLALVLRVPA